MVPWWKSSCENCCVLGLMRRIGVDGGGCGDKGGCHMYDEIAIIIEVCWLKVDVKITSPICGWPCS